jgi:prepilin-type N-terminal cleavage/methylation domain-containing protein/prepilin-type processing-associated H-X9-DG protein
MKEGVYSHLRSHTTQKWEAPRRPQGIEEHADSQACLRNDYSQTKRSALTLLELLIVVSIIAVLAAMTVPSLTSAKARARTVHCKNNIKNLGLAALLYAGDFENELPPRSIHPSWIQLLAPYYVVPSILRCPTGDSREKRTYIINGFSDWYKQALNEDDFDDFMDWRWPRGLNVAVVGFPSGTILFGEKLPGSTHYHVDFFQGAGNDLEEVDPARHSIGVASPGSNVVFVDGSVRFLLSGSGLNPVNLWATTEEWRVLPLGTRSK